MNRLQIVHDTTTVRTPPELYAHNLHHGLAAEIYAAADKLPQGDERKRLNRWALSVKFLGDIYAAREDLLRDTVQAATKRNRFTAILAAFRRAFR